jgi:hypothetical protein
MDDKNLDRVIGDALKAIARREGISVQGVRRNIETAIAAAREHEDPKVRALWRAIPMRNHGALTPEDVIAYLAVLNADATH